MKIVASDVRPAETPSSGTGSASAIAAATSRTETPASVAHVWPELANDHAAAAVTTAPPNATGSSTGRTWRVSGETAATLGRSRRRPSPESAGEGAAAGSWLTCTVAFLRPATDRTSGTRARPVY